MDLLRRFEEYLQTHPIEVESFHPHYEEALSYTLKAPAKRFRPLLLLSVVEAYEPLLVDSAMDAALAIEIFHTYSLIHDDLPVMDDADLRRSQPTLHRRYGELTAVLVGDALNTHAFYLLSAAALSPLVKSQLVRELAAAGGVDGMVHGQILDCHFERERLGIEQLERLHTLKTAKLIAASLKMGAIIADLPPKLQSELYDFGLDLGLLFQIQDDLIDALASSEEAGKTTQNDQTKNSFVTLLGSEGAMERADSLAQSLQQRLEGFDAPLKDALEPLLGRYLYRHHRLKGENG
jgi:farnesyl diphosphate synthase